MRDTLSSWRIRGAEHLAVVGLVKLGPLMLDHGVPDAAQQVLEYIQAASRLGVLRLLIWWLRRLVPHAEPLFREPNTFGQLVALLDTDPLGWRHPVLRVLASAPRSQRADLVAAVVRTADGQTVSHLRGVGGHDVVEARSVIIRKQAPRLHVRTFGPLLAHRGSWDARGIPVSKRRLRLLLSFLAAHAGRLVARDVVLDTLWPDSQPAAAVNSLNQSVFQLRRLLDTDYRDGESPAYLTSSVEAVGLDPVLVKTDLDEFRRRSHHFGALSPDSRTALDVLALIRGEYLADARYADWAEPVRARVQEEVRQRVLPLLESVDHEVAISAAHTLIALDEFDEAGHSALWRRMALVGRRTAARAASANFIERYRSEFGEDPAKEIIHLAASL